MYIHTLSSKRSQCIKVELYHELTGIPEASLGFLIDRFKRIFGKKNEMTKYRISIGSDLWALEFL